MKRAEKDGGVMHVYRIEYTVDGSYGLPATLRVDATCPEEAEEALIEELQEAYDDVSVDFRILNFWEEE